MKLVLLNLLLISFIRLFSQDSCVVKVCPNDCLNCYAGMQNVESANEKIKKTIVFPKLSEAEVKEYLNHVLNIQDISNYKIVISDSIYNSLNNSVSSEVYVYNKNELTDYSLLKKFDGFGEKNIFEIKLPDTIAISRSAYIINADKYFLISDYMFGRFIFISKSKENQVSVLTGQDLTTRANYIKIAGDTSAYNLFIEYKKQLKRGNADHMRIQPSMGSRNVMASFLLVPDIKFNHGAMGIAFKTGLIIFNSPDDYKILSIDDTSYPEEYYVNPGSFSAYQGKYYLQMGKVDKLADEQYIIGEFVLTDDKFVFSRFLDYQLPSEYFPASKYRYLGKVLTFVNPYAFLQYSLSYYDLDHHQTLKLPLEPVNLEFSFNYQNASLTKLESNYLFSDAIVSEQTIRILFKQHEKYYITEIDRKDNHLISKKEITNPGKQIKTGLYFYSDEELFYVSQDNSVVVEQINYQ